MEIMRRYEARLARLEEFVREWQRWRESKRTEPERIAKWMAILAPAYEQKQVSSRGPGPRDPCEAGKIPRPGRQASLAPARDDTGGAPADTPVAAPPPPVPPAPFLSPPPARPAIEFIDRGGGMSIAIDTATGQMANSAQVLAALAHMPKPPPDDEGK